MVEGCEEKTILGFVCVKFKKYGQQIELPHRERVLHNLGEGGFRFGIVRTYMVAEVNEVRENC